MGLTSLKTQFYLLVVSLIVSLIGIAVVKLSQGTPSANQGHRMTTVQTLGALEKVSSDSPEMSRFLKREKAAEEANQEAADSLPR